MTIQWFNDSPDAGDPACICSVCGKQIADDDAPAIRVFDTVRSKEARFHTRCFYAAAAEIGELQL